MDTKILRRLFWVLASVVLSVSLTGCSDDDGPDYDTIWDIGPVNLCFDITDSEGHSLLVEENIDSLLKVGPRIVMEGKEYLLSDSIIKTLAEAENTDSRAYFSSFCGLQLIPVKWYYHTPDLHKNISGAQYIIRFGEFSGERDYDHTMTLEWPEANIRREIRLTNRFGWKKHKPDIDRHIYIDNKEINLNNDYPSAGDRVL